MSGDCYLVGKTLSSLDVSESEECVSGCMALHTLGCRIGVSVCATQEMVELAAVDVPPLDVGFALIGGGSAVYHSFEGRFGSHGPVCNLPDPVLNGGWAVSVLLERRSHQGKLWGIWRFQAGARAFRRFQCQIQAFQRVQEGCPAIRRLGNLHLRGLHRRASGAGATEDLGLEPLIGFVGSIHLLKSD